MEISIMLFRLLGLQKILDSLFDGDWIRLALPESSACDELTAHELLHS
ncbi:MAG: hypothetical protein ACR2I0_10835 [Rhodoferax sp.]